MLVRSCIHAVRLDHRCSLRRVLHDAIAVDLHARHRDQPARVPTEVIERGDPLRELGGVLRLVDEVGGQREICTQRELSFLLYLRPAWQPLLDRAGDEHRRDAHAVGVGVRDPHQLDLCRLRHRGDLATAFDHRFHVGEEAVRAALGVVADLAAGRDGRVLVDAEVVDGAAVQPELVAVRIAHQDRPGRVEPVEILAGQLRPARRQCLGEEIARVEPDVAALVRGLVGPIEAGLQLGEDLRDRAALVAQVAVGVPRAVEVPVDDPGHDHPPMKVGHACIRTSELPCVSARADEDDPAVTDRNRLLEPRRVGAPVPFRAAEDEKLAVEEDRVRGLRRRGPEGEGPRHHQQEKGEH